MLGIAVRRDYAAPHITLPGVIYRQFTGTLHFQNAITVTTPLALGAILTKESALRPPRSYETLSRSGYWVV